MQTIQNKRWLIAVAATLTHLFLGTVYAWSFFQLPISRNYGWSQTETAWTFSIAIFMLGITAAWCGSNIKKFGVRKLAVSGAILYALGYLIAYFALKYQILALLYLGFGMVGGTGLGMAYVTPVAAVSGWFPEKRGLVTGMVVMGFGLGAFIMSKTLAPFFLKIFNGNLENTFLAIGTFLLIVTPLTALGLHSKPAGKEIAQEPIAFKEIKSTIFSTEYISLWAVFTLNIIAGMIFIAFQSPLLQDLLLKQGLNDEFALEQKGATLIGVSALFNGLGRIFWGSLSDKTGRIAAFRALLLIQILIFTVLIFTESPVIFSAGVCLVLLCYGGGFGVLPSLIQEKYGTKLMPTMYGITLTGWGIGGVFGPQITAAFKDRFPDDAALYSFLTAMMLLIIALALSFLIKRKKSATALP